MDCPTLVNGAFRTALEHIVIDYPVDVAGLGAGVHDLTVPTNGPAYFPTNIEQRAWLRITLSERESNKPLTANGPGHAANYGDGRGYDEPFRLGETEDYLIPGPSQEEIADISVRKRGAIRAQWDPNANMKTLHRDLGR